MARKRITYGDLFHLLKAEGYAQTAVDGPHALFENADAKASVVLPLYQSNVAAAPMHVALVKQTMLDFGVMTEIEFDWWIADPKHFQAA